MNVQTHTGVVHASRAVRWAAGLAPACAKPRPQNVHFLSPTAEPVTCRRCLAMIERRTPDSAVSTKPEPIATGLYCLDVSAGMVWIERDDDETPARRWVARDTEHLADSNGGSLRHYRTLGMAVAAESGDHDG